MESSGCRRAGEAPMRVRRICVDGGGRPGCRHSGADAEDGVVVDGSSEEKLMTSVASEGKLPLIAKKQLSSRSTLLVPAYAR
jgi:hypothetical protein